MPAAQDPPVTKTRGLLEFTDDTLAYAGHYVHEGNHAAHTHSFVELAVVVGGSGFHVASAERRELEVGDVLILRPGVWHGYEDCRSLDIYNCCFSTDLLRHELAWMQEDPMLGYLLWSGPYAMERRGLLTVRPGPDALDACIEHLRALDGLRSGTVRGDIIGRLSLLLAILGRAAAGDGPGVADSSRDGHLAVVQALRLMEASLAYPWTLKEIADRLHLAPGYLARLFKSATGVPPMTYLSRFRAETAAAMLLDTDLPVTQICRSVGWPDPSNFARRFKSHFGMAASTYRTKFSRIEEPPRA